jgi:3-hydroxyacyl-[acyl-carrier-protein] dehydratase
MTSTGELTLPLDHAALERILPHRYPFLLVDRIVELEPDRRIVGIKNVTRSDPHLAGQHTDRPVLPSMILMEAVAQVGAIMVLAKPENRDRLIFFMGIDWVRFRRPAYAGDVVVIEATVRRMRGLMGRFEGAARIAGKIVADGALTFALGPEASASRR